MIFIKNGSSTIRLIELFTTERQRHGLACGGIQNLAKTLTCIPNMNGQYLVLTIKLKFPAFGGGWRRGRGILRGFAHIRANPDEIAAPQRLLKPDRIRTRKLQNKVQFIDSKKKSFVGSGTGTGTLNAYRCIDLLNKTKLFEKVYLTEGRDYQRMRNLYTLGYPLLSDKIRIPKLIHVSEGEKISLVYFEYIEYERPASADLYNQIFSVASILHRYGKNLVELSTDFTTDPKYLEAKIRFLTSASKHGFALSKASSYISKNEAMLRNSGYQCLAHGDLISVNLSKNSVIYDWDRSGTYPALYDLSYFISSLKDVGFDEACFMAKEFIENLDIDLDYEYAIASFRYFWILQLIRRKKSSKNEVTKALMIALEDR